MSREETYRQAAELYCEAVERYGKTRKALGSNSWSALTLDTELVHRRILAIAEFLAADQPRLGKTYGEVFVVTPDAEPVTES